MDRGVGAVLSAKGSTPAPRPNDLGYGYIRQSIAYLAGALT